MEAKIILQNLPQLISAVSACVQSVSDHCFSGSLIEETTYRKIMESVGTDTEKARILILAVRDSVVRNPTCFSIFMNTLEKVLPGVDDSLMKAMKLRVTHGSVESTEAPSSETCQIQPSSKPLLESDLQEFSQVIEQHNALKGIADSDSMCEVISSEHNSRQLSVKIADPMITPADHNKVTLLQYFNHCTLQVQAEEIPQGAMLCKMTQTALQHYNSDDNNEMSIIEVQAEDQVKSDQDCEVLECVNHNHARVYL